MLGRSQRQGRIPQGIIILAKLSAGIPTTVTQLKSQGLDNTNTASSCKKFVKLYTGLEKLSEL